MIQVSGFWLFEHNALSGANQDHARVFRQQFPALRVVGKGLLDPLAILG